MAANVRKPLSATIEGVLIQLRPLGDGSFWGTRIGKSLILQGSLETRAKVHALLQVLKEIMDQETAARLAVEQLGLPESEWDAITDEHILLAWLAHEQGLSLQTAQLNLPTQPLYVSKDTPPTSEFLLRTVAKLTKFQNVDAWESYCYWLHEEMERLLETFHLESMDVYTLQALLLDFVHEVRASLLLTAKAEVTETLLKLGAQRKLLDGEEQGDSTALEKILVKRRGEAREELAVQYETLRRIVPVIAAIEEDHPDLIPLKWKAKILGQLLGPQLDMATAEAVGPIERWILLQLLHEELGIVSFISSNQDRRNIAFAVQVAVAIMRQKNSLETLLDLALHWKESVRTLDQGIAERGEGYRDGLSERERLVDNFRQVFVEVVEHLCIPMTAMRTKPHDLQWHQNQVESREILDLFPVLRPVRDKEGRSLHVRLVKQEAGEGAKELTTAGHQLLIRLLSNTQ